METKALLFSIEVFSRNGLDKLTTEGLYKLACDYQSYGETQILSLDEFARMVNEDEINFEIVWLYFVNV